MREMIRGWRFYDHFRTDVDAPARLPQLGTRTPVLHHDGRDLPECHPIELEKTMGQTQVMGQGMLDEPAWHWPDK